MPLKLNHLAIPYLALLAFIFGGIATGSGIGWYHTLTLPLWAPSTSMIAFIWAIIYICVTWSLLILWNKTPHDRHFMIVMSWFAIGAVINIAWSIAFFQFHLLAPSALIAAILGLFVLALAGLIFPRSRTAAVLLLPYAAWVIYASYLNHTFAVLNP